MKKILTLLPLILFFLLASSAFADDLLMIIDKSTQGEVLTPLLDIPEVSVEVTPEDKVGVIFFLVVDFILYAIGIAAVVMIVYSGFRYVVSTGEEEQITHAKQTLLYAVLGLFAVILALLVIENVSKIFY